MCIRTKSSNLLIPVISILVIAQLLIIINCITKEYPSIASSNFKSVNLSLIFPPDAVLQKIVNFSMHAII